MSQKAQIVREIEQGAELPLKDGEQAHVRLALVEVEKEFKGEKKTSHYITVGKDASLGIEPSTIRLYYPLLGSYKATDDEISQLFSGNKLHIDNLPKKDGGTYSADFIFNPWAERSFVSPKDGKTIPLKYTGEITFAPRETVSDSVEW